MIEISKLPGQMTNLELANALMDIQNHVTGLDENNGIVILAEAARRLKRILNDDSVEDWRRSRADVLSQTTTRGRDLADFIGDDTE